MKTEKNEKEISNYAGLHLKNPGPVKIIERSDLKKLPDNAVVLGQLGRGMSFSMKVKQLKRTQEERKGGTI